jgi:protein MpaA
VVGAIHGDEPGGLAVARALRRRWAARVPSADLWVVDSFNPDGRRRRTRGNARGVDLNRNFPYRWKRGARGRYWGGPRPLSEPESRAIRALILRIRPDVTIWYHQPWGAVLACGRSGNALQRRYGRLARMRTSCRGRGLRGTATSWQNARVGGKAFVVELAGGQVSSSTARRHARAAAIIARGG